MPLKISRLRRWFAIAAVAAVAVVAGTYFYVQRRVENVLKHAPKKMELNIKQSLEGFTLAPSVGGRTIFKLQAKKAVQFKGDHASLHDVTITLYGRDSSRFDQIYGSEFEYDPTSGDVSAKGEVRIDLEANPVGLASPDQSLPPNLKNPIHLKTSDLIFNRQTGDAHTNQKVDFEIPQAQGSAVGVSYSSKNNVLTLHSQIEVKFTAPENASIQAAHGTFSRDPREIILENVHFDRDGQRGSADKSVLKLNDDNALEQVVASGNVHVQSPGKDAAEIHANQLEVTFADQEAILRSAIFSGDVGLQSSGANIMQAHMGRLLLNYGGKSVLQKVHAQENVKLVQRQKSGTNSGKTQDMEITAPAVDFSLAGGKIPSKAETSGAAQILLRPTAADAGQTLISADLFQAQFDKQGKLAAIRGTRNARIVSSAPRQPDRVSTSDALLAIFGKDKTIQSVTQEGNFSYNEGDRKASAERASYVPASQLLELQGSPRIMDRGMITTANTIRMNRITGDGFAEGNVKSTYSDLKAQPGGALLSSSSPIHITARAMTAHRSPANALYTGDVRLWQEGNVIEGPSMEFDRNQRSITALGSAEGRVSTVLVQSNKRRQVTPVTITASRFSYVDSQRKAHFTAGVTVKASDFTVTATEMDIFLQASSAGTTTSNSANQLSPAGRLDRIVAQGDVVISQTKRKATGDQLIYTAAEDKFVLKGGPPCIFDAEQGKITAVSLTLFRTDDRVLIEGTDASPSVTQTQVAR